MSLSEKLEARLKEIAADLSARREDPRYAPFYEECERAIALFAAEVMERSYEMTAGEVAEVMRALRARAEGG